MRGGRGVISTEEEDEFGRGGERGRAICVDPASDSVQIDADERLRENSIEVQNVVKINRVGVSLRDAAVADWVVSTDCQRGESEVQEDWRGVDVRRGRTDGVSDRRADKNGEKSSVFRADFVSGWHYIEWELRVFQSFDDRVIDGELRRRREEGGEDGRRERRR
jgi:hypothetical protein